MSGAITWNDILTLITIVGSVGGMWWFLQSQITANIKALDEYKLLVSENLDDYKLLVSEKYIKSESLQKLEERLLASEARMIASIDTLSDRIDRLVDRLPAKTTHGA